MGTPDLTPLLAPSSIAVVGASPRSYVGRVLCENLAALRYGGAVYPVNPRYDRVLEWACFPTLDDVPGAPEAVVAAVSFDRVPEVVRTAGKRGARAAVVPGGGFTETGPEAVRIQAEIAAAANEFGMSVCGPNCMGVIRPPDGSSMYIGTIAESLLPGRVALVSQSGSVVEAAVNMGPRIGFSALVSCGNEAVTTVGDYLQWFARDDETTAVALFVEGFRDPRGFVDGARALRDAGKPLAVLQGGRSKEAAAAIAAHSGTLAGNDEVVTGLLHQLGAIGVDDLDELFEVAELLGHGRLPRGRRIFIATDSGGESNLIADHARWMGLELPRPSERLRERLQGRWPNFSYIGNPIDPWGVDADYETLYAKVLAAAVDEDVDVVAVALDKVTPWAGENETHLGEVAARALIAAQGAAGTDVLPVFFTVPSTGPAVEKVREPLRAARIPLLHGLRPAMVAIRRAWWWRQWRARTAPAPSGSVGLSFGDERGPVLSEAASRDVLARYGVPVVESRAASTAAEAGEEAERIGFPVVVKADVEGIAHKSAAGLVATMVATRQAAETAFENVVGRAARLAARGGGSAPRGALVQETASGVELICGFRQDPAFGPVVLVGVGGTLTEVVHAVSVRLCPVAPEDLDEMLDESPVGRLVDAAGADRAAVQAVIDALSRMAVDHPEIAEVDVNPLFAGRHGIKAADALVVLAPPHETNERSTDDG